MCCVVYGVLCGEVCGAFYVVCDACCGACESFVLVSHSTGSVYMFSSRKKYISKYNTREPNMLRNFCFHRILLKDS